jgi:hypothetical protein
MKELFDEMEKLMTSQITVNDVVENSRILHYLNCRSDCCYVRLPGLRLQTFWVAEIFVLLV